jgi:hypothetical protein
VTVMFEFIVWYHRRAGNQASYIHHYSLFRREIRSLHSTVSVIRTKAWAAQGYGLEWLDLAGRSCGRTGPHSA